MAFYNNVIAGAAGSGGAAGYEITRSLRFNDGDSSNLVKNFSSTGNQKTWTISMWVKRGALGIADTYLFESTNTTPELTGAYFDSSDKLYFRGYTNTFTWRLQTTRVFRDPSAWYHLVFVFDSTNSTSGDRVRLYVNGTRETTFDAELYPSPNHSSGWNYTGNKYIGSYFNPSNYFDGYLAEIHSVDGQALAASDFGEFDADTGVWNPKEYTGTYPDTLSTEMTSVSSGNIFPANGTNTLNALDGSTSTALDCRRGTHASTTSIRFTPSTAITGVTKIRVWAPFANKYQINGGGYQAFTGQGGWSEIYNSSSISLTTLDVIRDSGNSGSDYGHQLHAIEINDVILTRDGSNNSFHLDFSDNSSNAALGANSSGTGTTLPGVSFDGVSDSLLVGNSADYNFTGDFTAEAWVYVRSFSNDYAAIFGFSHDSDQHGWNVLLRSSGRPHMNVDMNYTDLTGTLPLQKLTHIALVRSGSGSGNVKFYINGVADSTTLTETDETGTISSTQCMIGAYPGFTTRDFDGVISNVRLVKGTALYTSNFSPPTAPLTNVTNTKLLCCQSSSSATSAAVAPGTLTANGDAFATSLNDGDWTVNNLSVADGAAVTVSAAAGALPIRSTTGDQGGTAASGVRTDSYASNLYLALPLNTNTSDVSNSINSSSTTKSTTNQSTATSSSQSRFYGASSYWNANSDGILVAQSGSELVVGTGDFTIEFWFRDDSNHSGTGGRCYLFDNRIGGSVVGDPPTIVGRVDGSSTITYESSGGGGISHSLSTDNKWIHFAAVRNSGTTTLYINGSSVGSHSDTTNYTNNGIGIGRATDANYGWAGYIQDFRVYKAAKYTSNFSIPAEANPSVGAGCDSLIDTPTNYEASSGNNGGNYATMNPLVQAYRSQYAGNFALSNGNLDLDLSSGEGASTSTIAVPTTGKYYFEVLCNTQGSDQNIFLVDRVEPYASSSSTLQVVFRNLSAGATLGIAVNRDTGVVTKYVNGSSSGTFTAAAVPYHLYVYDYQSGSYSVNFGQRPFAYTPPTGFKSLCTQNFDDPLIADPSTVFDTITYTGNGSTQTISGLGFSPDLVWSKIRSSTGKHRLTDIVRGTANALRSDGTDAEFTDTNVTAFNSDGFDIGANGNASGSTYVAWTWDGGSSNTPISAGSLNSSVYDQSQNWSSLLSASGGSGFTNAGNGAFAGTDQNADYTYVTGASSGTNYTITLTPPSAISYTSSVVVRVETTHGEASIDGGTTWVSESPANSGIVTFNGPGSFTSIIVRDNRGQFSGEFHSVKIDGKLLVNSGVTPPSVPSIASTVRANPSAGFSIVSYAGTGVAGSVGHGLNSTPELIIIKNRDASKNWYINTTVIDGSVDYGYLNLTSAFGNSSASAPTSSVFNITTSHETNTSGDDHIAYCFAPVEGYSAIGSYTGNGSADGPFVYTGFRPAFLLFRATDSTHWVIYDSTRNTYNGVDLQLAANLSNNDNDENRPVDFLSNGFKIRFNSYLNDNNDAIIYYAVAENPFKTARAR